VEKQSAKAKFFPQAWEGTDAWKCLSMACCRPSRMLLHRFHVQRSGDVAGLRGSEITWDVEADFESGIGGFIVMRHLQHFKYEQRRSAVRAICRGYRSLARIRKE
jgi:hypothetical protein